MEAKEEIMSFIRTTITYVKASKVRSMSFSIGKIIRSIGLFIAEFLRVRTAFYALTLPLH
jgi:hypothetical protein